MCFFQEIFCFVILLFIFILLYNILQYFIFCTARLLVSMNIFVQRVTVTSNMFISNPYLTNGISHVSVDRLT